MARESPAASHILWLSRCASRPALSAAQTLSTLRTSSHAHTQSFTSLPDASNMLAMFEPREPCSLVSELTDPPDAVVQVLSSVLVLEPVARAPAADVGRMLAEMRTEGDSAEVGEN